MNLRTPYQSPIGGNFMIDVYTKKGCSYCDEIKEWLESEDIGFQIKPIEEKENLLVLKEKNVNAIPHTVINKEKEVTGFNDNVKKIILETLR